jgi:hypothetical protein
MPAIPIDTCRRHGVHCVSAALSAESADDISFRRFLRDAVAAVQQVPCRRAWHGDRVMLPGQPWIFVVDPSVAAGVHADMKAVVDEIQDAHRKADEPGPGAVTSYAAACAAIEAFRPAPGIALRSRGGAACGGRLEPGRARRCPSAWRMGGRSARRSPGARSSST